MTPTCGYLTVKKEHDMAHDVDAPLFGVKASYRGFGKDKEEDEDLIGIVVGADDQDEDYDDGSGYDGGDDFF